MKKLFLVLVIAALVAGGAFAQYSSDQLGIGIVTQQNFLSYYGNYGLSLKIPSVPIFWGINFDAGTYYLNFGISADFYFLDQPLMEDLGIGWFVGAGVYANMLMWNGLYNNTMDITAGGRLPVGVYWMFTELIGIPLEWGFALVPSIGFKLDGYYNTFGLKYNVGAETWLRYWL